MSVDPQIDTEPYLCCVKMDRNGNARDEDRYLNWKRDSVNLIAAK